MKVLVVEAEEATLKTTGVMLNKLGYKVGLASNCDEAFASTATRDHTMLFSSL